MQVAQIAQALRCWQCVSTSRKWSKIHSRIARGFTLLEVLISILVVAVGLIAVAGMQLVAVKEAQGAKHLVVATAAARDMADRMRASYLSAANFAPATGGGTFQTCTDPSAPCSPSDLLNSSYNLWLSQLAKQLPSGTGILCRDSSPDDGVSATDAQCTGGVNDPWVVKVWWEDKNRNTPTLVSPRQRMVLPFVTRDVL